MSDEGAIINFVFLGFTLICLFNFIFGKNHHNELAKFMGGFTISILAIFSNNAWDIAIAIFIVGLIIASERFMSFLAAVFRGDSEFLKSQNFVNVIEKMAPMSQSEINKKIEEEVDEFKQDSGIDDGEEEKDGSVISEKDIIKADSYRERIPVIERDAIKKYERLSGIKFKQNVKFGNLIVDAAGVNEKSLKTYFLEVKIFPKVRFLKSGVVDPSSYIYRIRDVVSRSLAMLEVNINNMNIPNGERFVLVVISVFDTKKDLNGVNNEMKKLKQEYNYCNSRITVRFMSFNANRLNSN